MHVEEKLRQERVASCVVWVWSEALNTPRHVCVNGGGESFPQGLMTRGSLLLPLSSLLLSLLGSSFNRAPPILSATLTLERGKGSSDILILGVQPGWVSCVPSVLSIPPFQA